MTFGSLFAGIGGLDLGLERAGMECRWQVEIDPYCRRVLTKHWPDVPKYEDVKDVGKGNLEPVDLICGGFPCQDISYAGKGAGLAGERSGLWYEFARIIGEMGPRYVLVENVSALLTRGLGDVLGTLADLGYDAEWSVLPACAVGAPHPRERVFLVAYPAGLAVEEPALVRSKGLPGQSGGVGGADVPGDRWKADQPPMVGVAYGDARWVDVSRSLGNAVVPAVAEFIGRRIMEAPRQNPTNTPENTTAVNTPTE